ncbi:MAG TPA: RNA polymerase subunit sigma-70 [Parvularcula sp.]|nr:RNA polymerase subunit sigma-70 [Parvularcula sp.]HBS33348.1 RNA polymerase subunit sigma-70 [Parvularcula sp.]HBS35531.1 RNA polymerase subunit sigma-70 [Parvularcula sp.]
MTTRDEDRIHDEFLAASARAGDRSAFNALARRWEKKLLRHAWRLTGEAEAARDIAQDAWSSIAAGLKRLDDSAAFPAFAFCVVSRRAADHIRAKKRRRALHAAAAAELQAPVELSDAAASGRALQAALAALPDEQRAAVALFYLEDLSIAEIAVALDVPPGTVKTRLMAAREKLKAAFGVKKESIDEQA